ncbi:MAG TPA: hypothetical protein VGQ65_25555 [Thermoanaerobaculia bacterium]|jgi:hypothetical protein|nr:hypothetical protein [Thermoanaerobaculia bacterium]
MASEPIYKFFQALYEEESKRFAELESRARLYFSIASLYVGAIAFKFDDVIKFVNRAHVPAVVIVLDGAAFVVAILFCVLAMQVRKYEGISDPDEILNGFDEDGVPNDIEFYDDRVIDYSVAIAKNSAVNNRVATWLSVSGFSILAGVAGQVILFVYIAIQQIRG